MSVTIWHNPRCSKSRLALQLLEENGVTPTIVEYLKLPPSAKEINIVLKKLGLEPRDVMRKGEDVFGANNLSNDAKTRDELITAMVNNPILIERPIVIKGDKAAIGRPPESILEIL
jgi:arsenate reductase (glutaredoxin)